MATALILFIIGTALLIGGAKLLVHGAIQIARAFKISSLVVGLTVVAFGTSTPEIAFCILAALRGEGNLLMGNIVGSNILNILLVLGISATITPLFVKKQLIWWDVPIMIGFSILFWLFASFGQFYRWEGIVLVAGIIIYLFYLYFFHKKETSNSTEKEATNRPIWLQLVWIIVGLIFLGYGSDLLIKSSVTIAKLLGVSELLIGLTVVALGTSIPEIATTLVAISKKEKDLAVGNVIGSNLFNLLAVMGIAAIVSPNPIQISHTVIIFDIPVMVAVSIATLPIFITGHLISRWEGILFLFYYALYISYLLLNTLEHAFLPLFTSAFFFFILPLTLITIGVGIIRHVYRHR